MVIEKDWSRDDFDGRGLTKDEKDAQFCDETMRQSVGTKQEFHSFVDSISRSAFQVPAINPETHQPQNRTKEQQRILSTAMMAEGSRRLRCTTTTTAAATAAGNNNNNNTTISKTTERRMTKAPTLSTSRVAFFVLLLVSCLGPSDGFQTTTLHIQNGRVAKSVSSTAYTGIDSTKLFVLRDPPPTFIPPPIRKDRGPPKGGDMAYTKDNIDRQTNTYKKIRDAGGVQCVLDVYARAAPQSAFWFVGKMALCSTASPDEGVSRQWNLIEEHACRLRPIELGRAFGQVELFVAPGDTEAACNQNKLPLQRINKLDKDTVKHVALIEVGFVCEYVTSNGVGFFVNRNSDGSLMNDEDLKRAYKL